MSFAALVDWETHQLHSINRDSFLASMAGHILRDSDFIGTVDYKDTGTLKSCHREFRLIPPMRLLIKADFQEIISIGNLLFSI